MPRAGSLASVLALVFALASPAAAQERLALRWAAPPGCPDAAALRAEVVRLLGGAVPDGPPVTVVGETVARGDGYRLTLRTEMDGAPGERLLEGDRCEELAGAAALIVALMIDPEAVVELPLEPAPEPPQEPPADPAPTPLEPPPVVLSVRRELAAPSGAPPRARAIEEDPTPPSAPVRDEEGPAGFLGVSGGVDVGTVPAPSAWLAVEGGWGVPLIDARLRGSVVLPQSGLRAPTATAGAEVTSVSVDARACVHPFEGLRGLYGCGGLILGVSVAQGFGLAATETGVGTFFGAVVSLAGRWRPVSWLGLGLDATLVIPFNPLEFAVRGTTGDEVFLTQEPVSGRFGLAGDVHF